MPKRQSGYRVTIQGFLPVDPADIASQQKAINALAAAGSGSLADLVAMLADAEMHSKLTTRTVDDPAPPPTKSA